MRYVKAKAHQNAEEKAYRIYATDCLRMISENTAKPSGVYMKARYIDIIKPKKEETRTANEIIDHIKKRLEV